MGYEETCRGDGVIIDAGLAPVVADKRTIAETKIDAGLTAFRKVYKDAIAEAVTPVAMIALILIDSAGKETPLVNGLKFPADRYRIEARPSVTVGSIAFGSFMGQAARHENVSPFTLFPDTGTARTIKPFPAGSYSLSVTAYSGKDKAGAVLASASVTFDVTGVPDTETPPTPGEVPANPTAAQAGCKGTLTAAPSGFKPVGGKTYSNLKLGKLDLAGISNVTFLNCDIDAAGGSYGANCHNSGTNRVFKNCRIHHVGSAGVYGENFSAIGCLIEYSAGDGFKPQFNCVMRRNHVRYLGYNSPEAHADGFQTRGGKNIRSEENTYDLIAKPPSGTHKGNAGCFVQLQCDGIVIKGDKILCNNTGIHGWPEGGSMSITGCAITAKIPLNISDEVSESGNTITKL